jgi:hypothetical protein
MTIPAEIIAEIVRATCLLELKAKVVSNEILIGMYAEAQDQTNMKTVGVYNQTLGRGNFLSNLGLLYLW